jgi:uncharacterized phage protein gp47/JayE
MTTLSDLISQLKGSEFISSVKTIAASVGLFPDDWEEGDAEEAIVESVGDAVAQLWNTFVWYAIRGGFLDYAERGWLTLLARNVFNVERILATFATGTWTGTNATASPIGPFNPGDLVFVSLDNGKTYRNSGTVTFAPSTTTAITLQAEEIGTGSNAAPTRVVLQTTVLGVTGTNAASIAGRDDETDDALRARCRLKPASLSPNGPSQAYEFVCLTPDFHGVTVNRVKVSLGSVNGTVSVLIAGVDGAFTDPADVAAVNTAVLKNVAPTGATPTVTSAVGNSIPVTWQGWSHPSANVDPTAAEAAVNAALVLAFQSFPIGGDEKVAGSGFVYKNVIETVIKAAVPGFFEVEVTAPAADVAIAANEVPTLGAVNKTVTVAP